MLQKHPIVSLASCVAAAAHAGFAVATELLLAEPSVLIARVADNVVAAVELGEDLGNSLFVLIT